MNNPWLSFAQRIQAIAQAGLTYSLSDYDTERYQELRDISVAMLSELTGAKTEQLVQLFASETGYQTPKVDVRGVVFRDGQLLLVKEKIDGRWALPGGWADVGLTPKEVVVKEIREEAGLEVTPMKLLAVLDKKQHPHPPSPFYVYKFFIRCEIVGGAVAAGMETSDAAFFSRHHLPELSVDRNTASQLQLMFDFLDNPAREVVVD